MKEKILKIVIFSSGVVCLFAFLAIRSLPLMNLVLNEKIIPQHWEFTEYGELYYFNYISDFKEKQLPAPEPKYRLSDENPTLEEADVLTFGDSFFDFMRQKTFPQRLADTLNAKVFYERFSFPLEYLHNLGYEKSNKPKLLIYETTERYIAKRFSETHSDSIPKIELSPLKLYYAQTLQFLFPWDSERFYNQLLKRSYATSWLYSFISDIKFELFGYVSSVTPKYYLDDTQPWLFYNETVNDHPTSFYYQHSDKEIQTYCDNIEELAKSLKEQYNLVMVFMPLPNKYTLYHDLLNDDQYNELLPKIYGCLEERNVPTIKVYEPFLNADEIIYYGTDTHWNKKGIDIALKHAMPVIKTLNQQYSIKLNIK